MKNKVVKEQRPMTMGPALIGFLGPMLALIGLILAGVDVAIAMLASCFFLVIFGLIMRVPFADLEKAMEMGSIPWQARQSS